MAIQLGKDAKWVCDCGIDSSMTLNHFDEIEFNHYRIYEGSVKNDEIVNEIINSILDVITKNPDFIVISEIAREVIVIAKETNKRAYFDSGKVHFNLSYEYGDIIRFRKNFDIIEIKTMYHD